ncbi:glycoside hydrolase family 13 protein [Seonamhaeicola maritimus]|uniref:Glycoside hydrolase family 13 protein n=1 Tax=Seonamhaeicola maritimus TaxID=2591822 RepID=A0A5C7GHA2_9FLAO|nr:glycoside hydrolase family 13 protein [Seonamhaeicola maritimus]TXG36645.1 glycoside hydrolase family 13 protein [Seonamhaeicola maritimus]
MKGLLKLLAIIILFMGYSCKQNNSQEPHITPSESVTEIYDIELIEPLNWWVGFKNQELQLLVKHQEISKATPKINYSGVTIREVHKADSPNYLFIDLMISENTKAGKFNIEFVFENGESLTHTYELKARQKSPEEYKGFDSSDAIYLITPDRFVNANPENDIVETLNETTIDRTDGYKRHGGDIAGIINHIDYIHDMGFTAIWPCPLLTNDMPRGSYHGYAMTDFYEIDPRFGTMKEYLELSSKLSDKDMKLVMDQVANHCGLEHWWMKDLPFKDWVNYQAHYEKNKENWNGLVTKTSSHRRTSNQDLYASQVDKEDMTDGWFVSGMPDLNQRNPFMAKYIIQNSIWWVETANLGGIRQDTYPYPDKHFMSNWVRAIMTEYPNFSIVGEQWSYNPLVISYWQEGAINKDGYDSDLKSVMDFPMQQNIVDALNENEAWDKGLVKIYEGLANDFHYANPKDLLIFPDNHDMSRIFTQLGGDKINTKIALSYLLTLPRIPQVYYGTEILMDDFDNPGDHGLIRTDFSGGWKGDEVNAFTGEGLTADQKDMQSFLRKVLNYRKSSKAIHNGETMHFAPQNGVYVLFRILGDETVVHVINKNEGVTNLDLPRFNEIDLNGKTLKNIITDETIVWGDMLKLNEKGSMILTTKF